MSATPATYDIAYLQTQDYRALQKLCVLNKLRAVGSKQVLLERLTEFYTPKQKDDILVDTLTTKMDDMSIVNSGKHLQHTPLAVEEEKEEEKLETQMQNLQLTDPWYIVKEVAPESVRFQDGEHEFIYNLGYVIGKHFYKSPAINDMRAVIKQHRSYYPDTTLSDLDYMRYCNPIVTLFRETTQGQSKHQIGLTLQEMLDYVADCIGLE